jgi:hypothetical protein
MLLTAAEEALGRQIPDELVGQLEQIATGYGPESATALQAFSAAATVPGLQQRLLANPAFGTLVSDLAGNFLLLVPLHIEPGERRVISFAYDEALTPRDMHPLERLLVELGFRPFRLSVAFFALGRASSYHIETAPPEGVFIEHATLWLEGGSAPQELQRTRPIYQAHLYLVAEEAGIARDAVATFEVAFNIHPSGFLVGLLLTSAITTTLFAGGLLFRYLGVHPAPDSTPAVLMVLPGIFSAYLVRPGEHELVRRMFRWLRIQAVAMTLLAFWGASIVALQPPAGVRLWGWLAAFVLSAFITGSFTLVLVLGILRMRNRRA